MATLKVAATEGAELVVRVKSLEHDVKNLTEENKTVSDNFNSERVSSCTLLSLPVTMTT